jgi:hypothetical protein
VRSHGSLAALPFPWSNAGWAYRTGCIQTPAGSRRRVFLVGLVNLRVRDHLNCGIVGTLMRGGGGAATVGSAALRERVNAGLARARAKRTKQGRQAARHCLKDAPQTTQAASWATR